MFPHKLFCWCYLFRRTKQGSTAYLSLRKTPPQRTRTTLCQVRLGHSMTLRSYQPCIRLVPEPTHPECLQHDHMTDHLFDCGAHPTALTNLDLCTSLGELAAFLSSRRSFEELQPPLPGPSPEPAPSTQRSIVGRPTTLST